jgi:hypothetical protein
VRTTVLVRRMYDNPMDEGRLAASCNGRSVQCIVHASDEIRRVYSTARLGNKPQYRTITRAHRRRATERERKDGEEEKRRGSAAERLRNQAQVLAEWVCSTVDSLLLIAMISSSSYLVLLCCASFFLLAD